MHVESTKLGEVVQLTRAVDRNRILLLQVVYYHIYGVKGIICRLKGVNMGEKIVDSGPRPGSFPLVMAAVLLVIPMMVVMISCVDHVSAGIEHARVIDHAWT